jgi:hypothetical protein
MQTQTQNWLMPLCQYLQATTWATAIRTSLWAYPFIQLIPFLRFIVVARNQYRGRFAFIRRWQEAANGRRRTRRTFCMELDRILHGRVRRLFTLLGARNELHHQSRISHETIRANSGSAHLACLCPNENARLGTDNGNL